MIRQWWLRRKLNRMSAAERAAYYDKHADEIVAEHRAALDAGDTVEFVPTSELEEWRAAYFEGDVEVYKTSDE